MTKPAVPTHPVWAFYDGPWLHYACQADGCHFDVSARVDPPINDYMKDKLAQAEHAATEHKRAGINTDTYGNPLTRKAR